MAAEWRIDWSGESTHIERPVRQFTVVVLSSKYLASGSGSGAERSGHISKM